MRSLYILVPLLLLFSACDCVQEVRGIVLDENSHLPIKDVSVTKYKYSVVRPVLSDDSGMFEYNAISGGPFGCPDLHLQFSKKGYQTIDLKFDSWSENDTILMVVD